MARTTGRHRTIGGKRFFNFKNFKTRAAANTKADKMKATGRFFIRVLPNKGLFSIFCRER